MNTKKLTNCLISFVIKSALIHNDAIKSSKY